MKLDHDLIRNIVLSIEESWPPGHVNGMIKPEDEITKPIRGALNCEDEVLVEHLMLLEQAGFISGDLIVTLGDPREFILYGLTWSGHEFAANASDDGIWSQAKKKAGPASISIISDLLKLMIMDLISKGSGS